MKSVLLFCLLATPVLSFAGARLEAQLTTGFVKEIKKRYTLKMADDGVNWVLETYTAPESFPSNPADQTTEEVVAPKVSENNIAADGCLNLLLGESAELSYCPGWGNQDPYKLKIDGKEYSLHMRGMISVLKK